MWRVIDMQEESVNGYGTAGMKISCPMAIFLLNCTPQLDLSVAFSSSKDRGGVFSRQMVAYKKVSRTSNNYMQRLPYGSHRTRSNISVIILDGDQVQKRFVGL